MKLADSRYRPPGRYPEGWYLVEIGSNLAPGGLLQKEWMGKQIVVWRDTAGSVCASEAFCPHLGAHLGPASGGRVRDGRLVCPFHGFEYDVAGRCVATPNAPPPRTARLGVYRTREINGLIFAWWSSVGNSPGWELPEAPEKGWRPLDYRRLRMRGHPQETTENSVDINHLRCVHGYGAVKQSGSVLIEGAYLRNKFSFRRKLRLGFLTVRTDVAAIAHIWGLGFSFVELSERVSGLRLRQWILPTPVDDKYIEFVIALQVKGPQRGQEPLTAFLLRCLPEKLLSSFFLSSVEHDVEQDVTIWQNKRYQPLPILSRSDGEIMAYRKYCEQFYPELETAGRPLRSVVPPGIAPVARAGNLRK